MEINRPLGPEAPQRPVICPSPQPDGAQMPPGCIRLTAPDSPVAKSLGGVTPCQELGYCARANLVGLLLRQQAARQFEDPEPPESSRATW